MTNSSDILSETIVELCVMFKRGFIQIIYLAGIRKRDVYSLSLRTLFFIIFTLFSEAILHVFLCFISNVAPIYYLYFCHLFLP